MKVVIDTNVLMAGLLKDSIVRNILSSENISFYIPEHALNEIEKYKSYLINKSILSKEEIEEMLGLLLENIEIVPESKIKNNIKKAKYIMEKMENYINTALLK